MALLITVYIILGTMVKIEFEPDPEMEGKHPYAEAFVLASLHIFWPLALILSKRDD